MQTVKNKFENISNEHLQSIYKAANFILSLKQRKEIVQRTGAFYIDLHQVLKTLENQ